MNPTEQFVGRFRDKTGQHPNSFKRNPKELARIIESDMELTELFKKAVSEISAEGEKENHG